jgi:Co/Zn/Cd efflux system component
MKWLLLAAILFAKSYLSRLFSPENLPNIGLLLAGIIGIVVAIRTLKILGRQTTAIEKQGDALIDSERAWVMEISS